MENQRFLLFVALAFMLFLIYTQWQEDYAPKPEPVKIEESAGRNTSPESDIATSDINDEKDEAITAIPKSETFKPVEQEVKGESSTANNKVIEVVTDVFDIRIDTYRGRISQVSLRDYPLSVEQKDIPFTILDLNSDSKFVAESGLINGKDGKEIKPIYTSENSKYALQEGQDELRVPLFWIDNKGIKITKTFIFKRGDYLVEVENKIENNSTSDWVGNIYGRLSQKAVESSGGLLSGARSYTGAAVSSDFNKYEKVSFDDIKENWSSTHEDATDDGVIRTKTGWVAMLQHYFVVAWIPEQDEYSFFSTSVTKNGNHYISYSTSEKSVSAGSTAAFTQKIYMGPKKQKVMKEVAPNLERSVDYGPLFFIAEPLFIALDFIHGIIGNWGWAIIILTLIIKLIFFKLSEKSYKSMAKMRNLGPKIKQLKERYGDDRQKINQATMELYKKEGANPLGGCLPILIQMPVFLSLYWMLMESVELRQAPFMFWIVDLSIKDPYFILPIIMGATMLFQQKLNPAPADPMQAKVMMAMPIIFTVMFLWFPAGLVLYWVVNNTLSIAQQWVITKRVESGKIKDEPKKKKKK